MRVNVTGRAPVLHAFAVAAAALAAAGPALAAPTAEELDQRIKILERQLELQKEDADTKAKDATTTKIDDKGVSIKKGDFEFKIRAVVQADYRSYLDDAGTSASQNSDSFLFRRIRPTFEGSFGKLVGFRLTPEFAGANATGDSASIVDAYLDFKFDPAYTVRVGKVKGPVGLERLQSGSSTTFIERGFPTELAPNRDLGLQLQGDLLGSTVAYTLGVYNGTVDGRDVSTQDADSRKELGARLFFEPFKNSPGWFQGLGFGVGSSFGSKLQAASTAGTGNNNYLPRYRSPGQLQIFQYRNAATAVSPSAAGYAATYADGDHTRISPQFYYYRNSFGLLGEYISSEQEVAGAVTPAGGTTATAVKESLENTAWQVVTSYVITGEDAGFRGVAKPKNSFTVGGPGWGAFEVAARYGELEIDEDAFPIFASASTQIREATSYGIGVNWYLTSNLKTVLNYTQTEFEGGGGSTGPDREDEKTLFARAQLSF